MGCGPCGLIRLVLGRNGRERKRNARKNIVSCIWFKKLDGKEGIERKSLFIKILLFFPFKIGELGRKEKIKSQTKYLMLNPCFSFLSFFFNTKYGDYINKNLDSYKVS